MQISVDKFQENIIQSKKIYNSLLNRIISRYDPDHSDHPIIHKLDQNEEFSNLQRSLKFF